MGAVSVGARAPAASGETVGDDTASPVLPAVGGKRRRRTKTEEALDYVLLVQHIRTQRLGSDEAHRLIDEELAAEISRRREHQATQDRRKGVEREAYPLGEYWRNGRLPTSDGLGRGTAAQTEAADESETHSSDADDLAMEDRHRLAAMIAGAAKANFRAPPQKPEINPASNAPGGEGMDENGAKSYHCVTMITEARLEEFAVEADVPVAALRTFVADCHRKAENGVTSSAQSPALPAPVTANTQGAAGPTHPSQTGQPEARHPEPGTPVITIHANGAAMTGQQWAIARDQILLGKLQLRLEQRMAAIDLSAGKFTSLEQKKEAGRLVADMRAIEKLQRKLGLNVKDRPTVVVEANRQRSNFAYAHRPRRTAVTQHPSGAI